MESPPTELTRRYIIEHAEYTLSSASYQWQAWMWRQIVLLDIAGQWNPSDYPHYISEFWDIFCERNNPWSCVYFVVDTSPMELQSEEFNHYMKCAWLYLLDRDELVICFVEPKEMKRLIWRSILCLLGRQDRIRMFRSHDEALEWVCQRFSGTAGCAPPGKGVVDE